MKSVTVHRLGVADGMGTGSFSAVGMSNTSQTSVVCLHLFAPAKIEFERPHWYLIRRIFRILAVLPKSRGLIALYPEENIYQRNWGVSSDR